MGKRGRIVLAALACSLLLGAGALFGVGEYLSSPARHPVGDPDAALFATPVLLRSPQGDVAGWVACGAGVDVFLHSVGGKRT
jgi:hypothetical protein